MYHLFTVLFLQMIASVMWMVNRAAFITFYCLESTLGLCPVEEKLKCLFTEARGEETIDHFVFGGKSLIFNILFLIVFTIKVPI